MIGNPSLFIGEKVFGGTTNNILSTSSAGILQQGSLSGTTNQITVTPSSGAFTLSTPQNIATTSTPQFAKIGIGVAAHATSIFYAYNASSSNTILVETGGASSQAGLQVKNPGRAWSFSVRGDVSNGFCIADETAGAIRMVADSSGQFGFGTTVPEARFHIIENSSTSTTRGIVSQQFLNGTTGGAFVGRKNRVSGSTPISINSNDFLAEFRSQGYDGTSFVDASKIVIQALGTIGTGRMPTDMIFYTSTDAATSVVTEVMRLKASGQATFTTTTDSTSSTTGAMIISGGQVVTKNNLTLQGQGFGVTSTATAAGTTTLTSSSTSVQIFTGTTTQTVVLPAANAFGSGIGLVFYIKNRSTGTVTINRAGSDTIDAGTTLNVTSNQSATLVSNGSTAWVIV